MKHQIMEVMKDQELAWSDGDIEGFMQGYWHSDSLTFVGSRGLTYGWNTVLQNYKETYPAKEDMGTLTFEVLEFHALGRSNALVLGKYNLDREGRESATGYFTIVWSRKSGKWKIISDQSN